MAPERSARRRPGSRGATVGAPPLAATGRAHDPGPEEAARRFAAAGEAGAHPVALPGGAWALVGTASWTDPTMTAPGVFYPAGADSAEERLRYYATQFPLVEVDATYYALPARRTAELWLQRTPPGFTFDVKAFALLTDHPAEVKRLPAPIRAELPDDLLAKPRVYARDLPPPIYDEVWRLFREALEPLHSAGKLGAVLLQYPRWCFPTSESHDAMLEARERLGGLPCAVELRNASWFNAHNLNRTTRFFEEHRLPFVMVDGPQGFRSSVPPLLLVSSPDLAVVRFHGRRRDHWEAPVNTVERFRYLYDRAELAEWAPRIQEAATRAREVHLLMNNCYANYGATNAREMAQLLLA